jgi:hypothetical protein
MRLGLTHDLRVCPAGAALSRHEPAADNDALRAATYLQPARFGVPLFTERRTKR